ncbi:MAG: nucleotidyltransferase domain-containing protein [bacterium]|nr:nucleotidyltransferase domain-containing protein [bacterium]
MRKDQILEKLKGYCEGQEDIRLAFLFGSYSKDRAIKESDLDIALYLRDRYVQKRIFDIWNDLEDILKLDIELIILNTAPPTIAWSALRGIPVSIKNYGFYLEFMLRVSREAEDFQEFLFDLWHWRERIRKAA